MKDVLIIACRVYLISTRELDMSCTFESTINNVSKLSDCQSIETAEGSQCCIGVLSFYGKDQYFCEEFEADPSQEEIDSRINQYIKIFEDKVPGLFVTGKGSCSEDIKPYKRNKCTIEDTQKDSDFGNCTGFLKDDDSNYCCLFSGKLKEVDSGIETNVQFCKEIDKTEIKTKEDMINISNKIDMNSEMDDIKYLSCSPDIPEEEGNNYLKFYKLLFLISLLIIFV